MRKILRLWQKLLYFLHTGRPDALPMSYLKLVELRRYQTHPYYSERSPKWPRSDQISKFCYEIKKKSKFKVQETCRREVPGIDCLHSISFLNMQIKRFSDVHFTNKELVLYFICWLINFPSPSPFPSPTAFEVGLTNRVSHLRALSILTLIFRF